MKRDKGIIFKKDNIVTVSLKNIKINQPKRKQDNNWDRPQPVLTTYRGAVIVDLLDYIYVNKSFYTLKVRFQFPKEIPSQVYINKEEYYNIIGRIAERDNNGNIINKWEFEKILNIYNKQIDKYGLIYYIKQKYYNKETQEPKKSLKGYKCALLNFYKQHPKKLKPLDWA